MVARSAAASRAVTVSALMLDDVLVLAEFDSNTEDVLHYTERIREDRARRIAVGTISAG